jgi:hypothetical protein
VSVDLAVWDGQRPANDEEARAAFDDLCDRFLDPPRTPPSAKIAAYVRALTARYPELAIGDDDEAEGVLWGSGPLIENASGPIVYIDLTLNSVFQQGWRYCVETASSHGLVAFDPQSAALANPDPTAAPVAQAPTTRRGGAVYRWASLRSWRWPILRPLLALLRRFP